MLLVRVVFNDIDCCERLPSWQSLEQLSFSTNTCHRRVGEGESSQNLNFPKLAKFGKTTCQDQCR